MMGKSKKEKKHKKHKKEKKEKKEKDHMKKAFEDPQSSFQSSGFSSSLATSLQQRCEEGLDAGPRVTASQRRREEEKAENERLYQERLYNKPRPPSPSPPPQASAAAPASTVHVEERYVTRDDINEATAKVMRAEAAGDAAKAARLQRNLDTLHTAQRRGIKIRIKRRSTAATDALTRTSRLGMAGRTAAGGRAEAGESVGELARQEKRRTGREMQLEFTRMQMAAAFDDHFETGDGEAPPKKARKEKERVERPRQERPLNTACALCLHNRRKHLIIAVGEHCFLTLPGGRSLVAGHCLIVPRDHRPSGVHLDDDTWTEAMRFRAQVAKMVRRVHGDDAELVVMETALQLQRFPHAVFECVPVVDGEDAALLPAFFKKAFLDAGPRWNSNKKVVELRREKLKHAVPKDFPYFSVSFEAADVHMAHVVEEESLYSAHFAKEIVGGAIGLDATAWRSADRDEGVDAQMRKAVEFEEQFREFDLWTDADE